MFITRETDYAIRCVLYLARAEGRTSPVGEIAGNMRVPKSFLAKILQMLAKADILESSRGLKGGFRLKKAPVTISLFDVVYAVQGPAAINVCALSGGECELESVCGVHPVWIDIRNHIDGYLAEQDFEKLAARTQILYNNGERNFRRRG